MSQQIGDCFLSPLWCKLEGIRISSWNQTADICLLGKCLKHHIMEPHVIINWKTHVSPQLASTAAGLQFILMSLLVT